jgi:hypothetical protein
VNDASVERARLTIRENEFAHLAPVPALERFSQCCEVVLGFALSGIQAAKVKQRAQVHLLRQLDPLVAEHDDQALIASRPRGVQNDRNVRRGSRRLQRRTRDARLGRSAVVPDDRACALAIASRASASRSSVDAPGTRPSWISWVSTSASPHRAGESSCWARLAGRASRRRAGWTPTAVLWRLVERVDDAAVSATPAQLAGSAVRPRGVASGHREVRLGTAH